MVSHLLSKLVNILVLTDFYIDMTHSTVMKFVLSIFLPRQQNEMMLNVYLNKFHSCFLLFLSWIYYYIQECFECCAVWDYWSSEKISTSSILQFLFSSDSQAAYGQIWINYNIIILALLLFFLFIALEIDMRNWHPNLKAFG